MSIKPYHVLMGCGTVHKWAKDAQAELEQLRALAKEMHEVLIEAKDGLSTCYQVCDYPANGQSAQDFALRSVEDAIAKYEAMQK